MNLKCHIKRLFMKEKSYSSLCQAYCVLMMDCVMKMMKSLGWKSERNKGKEKKTNRILIIELYCER